MNRVIIPLLFAIGFQLSVLGQGSLTPPGAPAPTMKSLDQIEPRTPIAYEEYVISSPGSYYLTTNLTGASAGSPYGIWIASDNVTVDLNGFTIQGGSGSIHGIYIYGSHTNIIVRNGIITGWGGRGVDWNYPNSPPQNVVLDHLAVSANAQDGIRTANGYVVSDCSIQNNGAAGVLVAGSGSQIAGNTLFGNNAAYSSTSFGILLAGSNNRIEGNYVTGGNASGYGIQYNISGGTNNVIIKNIVGGNGANNYSTAGGSGNDVGPIGTAATSTSPWANISH